MRAKLPIAPGFLLLWIGLGLFIALTVFFLNPQLVWLAMLGLLLAVLASIAWVMFYPNVIRQIITGNNLRFSLTAIVVIIALLGAMIVSYVWVSQQNWRVDFSQGNTFSLDETATEIISLVANDTNTPPIHITAFYTAAQAALQDRSEILLQEYQRLSGGKVTYEYVDPDQNPQQANLFGARPGQIVVSTLDETGQPDVTTSELIPVFEQAAITNAISTLSTRGDFQAFIANVGAGDLLNDTGENGIARLGENLNRFRWTTNPINFINLTDDEIPTLLAPQADGEVLVIPGGQNPLPNEQMDELEQYLAAGGNVALFAAANLQGEPSLGTADALNDFLEDTYGIRIQNDLVIDPFASVVSSNEIVISNLARDHFIMAEFAPEDALIVELTHSIQISEELPPNITITPLAWTSVESYTIPSVDFTQGLETVDITPPPEEPRQSYVIGVAIEDANTGGKLVIFGNETIIQNKASIFVGIRNGDVALRSLAWASGFDTFFENIPRIATNLETQSPPLFATEAQLQTIRYLAVVVLPTSLILIGILNWWRRRSRLQSLGQVS